jgi:hypothetical protein
MAECDFDSVPLISSIPGPRGAAGPAGAPGSASTSGKNAYTYTTAPFVMPAALANVTITVADNAWAGIGQTIFIETAGYFLVVSKPSLVSMVVTAQAVPTNTAGGVTIVTNKLVTPASIAYIDSSAISDLANRVTVLETSPGGIRSFRSSTTPTAPTGGFRVGDLWFQTDGGGAIISQFRWDGSGWLEISNADTAGLVASLDALIVGVNIIDSTVDDLKQEHVLVVLGSGPTKRIAGYRVTVPGGGDDGDPTEFAIQADKLVLLGADGTGKDSPFFVSSGQTYIKNAFIKELTAQNLAVTGNLTGWNFGIANRLFHPTYNTKFFRSVDFGTSFADGQIFGAGNCLSGAYAGATPVIAYAPGAAGWTSGGLTACPDSDNKVRVQIQGRLIGYTGAILIYGQVNSGVPFALAARSSEDGGNSYIDASRILTGIALTDTVKIFVAPAAGDGTIVPATCRYEIDCTFYNW